MFEQLHFHKVTLAKSVNNGAYVIEMTKTSTVAFMKETIPWLFDVERNMSIGKKLKTVKIHFYKALANRFQLI